MNIGRWTVEGFQSRPDAKGQALLPSSGIGNRKMLLVKEKETSALEGREDSKTVFWIGGLVWEWAAGVIRLVLALSFLDYMILKTFKYLWQKLARKTQIYKI